MRLVNTVRILYKYMRIQSESDEYSNTIISILENGFPETVTQYQDYILIFIFNFLSFVEALLNSEIGLPTTLNLKGL